MSDIKRVSRRNFLKTFGLSTMGASLAACTRETSFSARTIATPTSAGSQDTGTGGHAGQSSPPAAATPTKGAATQSSAKTTPASSTSPGTLQTEAPITTAAQALNRLYEGNQRWIAGKSIFPNANATRRAAVTKSQKPFATILGCVDSRVPPEIVFDRGIGDLFVIRSAGHVIDNAVLGSIEFGVEELGIPLIMVLGHERCGAITATVEAVHNKTTPPGQIKTLVDSLKPAVEKAKSMPGEEVENAMLANIELATEKLKASTVIAEAIKKGKVRVVGARYDLDTGIVEVTVL
ncbi:MAG TPA: carbonic anhydrase [Anaerolineaceae bacterium]